MRPGRGAVAAIIAKDLRLFVRDRFYFFITVLGLVFFGGVFWVLPADVEDEVPIGLHLPGAALLDEVELDAAGGQGLAVELYGSREELEQAIAVRGEVVAGLDFPLEFFPAAAAGEETTVRVLLAGDAPEELRPALTGAVRQIAHELAGDELPVTVPAVEEMVLGVDRADAPVSLREQLRPLLIFIVLMMEMFALASLVATEIAQRTATAILATPVRVGELLAAKAVLGTALAFGQALLVALVTGTLGYGPLLITVALLLGALLVTGFGLIAGATGQDFVAIVFWSVLFFIPLVVPAFAVLFPGTPALWIRALPSYGLVETLVRTTAYGEGWRQAWPYLALLAAWCAAAFAAGTAILGRRMARA